MGGTTRRDREERTADRRAARDLSRHERQRVDEEGLEHRVQSWITRLLAAEKTTRTLAQEFVALNDQVKTQQNQLKQAMSDFSDKIGESFHTWQSTIDGKL